MSFLSSFLLSNVLLPLFLLPSFVSFSLFLNFNVTNLGGQIVQSEWEVEKSDLFAKHRIRSVWVLGYSTCG